MDIVMVKRDGRFSGEAFVVLGNLQLVEAAMQKHRQFIGQRFIEIFPAQKRVGFALFEPSSRCLDRNRKPSAFVPFATWTRALTWTTYPLSQCYRV